MLPVEIRSERDDQGIEKWDEFRHLRDEENYYYTLLVMKLPRLEMLRFAVADDDTSGATCVEPLDAERAALGTVVTEGFRTLGSADCPRKPTPSAHDFHCAHIPQRRGFPEEHPLVPNQTDGHSDNVDTPDGVALSP